MHRKRWIEYIANEMLLRILNQPYPKEWKSGHGMRMALLSGCIVFVFLWVFEPFGIVQSPVKNINLFMLGYGMVTSLVVILFLPLPYIFKNYFNEENWTVGKNIGFFVFNFFFIGIANLLYTHFVTSMPLMWGSFLFFQFVTVAVAFVVAGIVTLIKYSRLLHLNTAEAKQIEAEVQHIQQPLSPGEIILVSENEKDEVLRLAENNLLYIGSADNYSKVVFLENAKVKSQLLRSSLKRTESQIHNPFVFRCHRSFLVNLSNVVSVSGNSQGYRLHLKNCEESIPVARRTGEELHHRLNSLFANKN